MTLSHMRSLGEIARVFFSFGSPRLLGAQLLTAAALRPLAGPLSVWDLVVVAGVVVYWPLQEWWLHKALLHARPRRVLGRSIELGAARTHAYHHAHPTCAASTLLPTSTVAWLVPLHLALWLGLAPTRGAACTGIVALGAAALLYEWIHFLTHSAYRPRSSWFAEVKRRHMLHHHKSPDRFFAFVVPSVDDWMGTGK
jgi:hypothetical protein